MNSSFYKRYGLNITQPEENSIVRNEKISPEENLIRISKRYGADFYNALGGLYKELVGKQLDTKKILNTIEILNQIKQDLTKRYLYSLLFPEKSKGCRIPTKFPVPSATFQLTDFIIITPNSSGNFVVQWCPQNLAASTALNEVVVNTANTLTGMNSDITYVTSTALTNALVTQWQAFRVVSACMVVQYVGSFVNLQGTFGGGLDISASNSNSYDANYSNFSNIDDRLWSQISRVDEGLKVVYFPKDYNDLSFIRPNQTPSQNGLASAVRLLVYGQSLPVSTQCIRIDFIKNVEAVPGVSFADVVETGFLESNSMIEHSLEGSRLLTKNNLVVSRIDEQEMLEKTLKLPGNDYLEILSNSLMQEKRKSRTEDLKNLYNSVKEGNGIIDKNILLNPMAVTQYIQ
jgi:hypothetical protein